VTLNNNNINNNVNVFRTEAAVRLSGRCIAVTDGLLHHNESCSMPAEGRGAEVRSITVFHLLLRDNKNMNSANFRPEAQEGAPQIVEQTSRRTHAHTHTHTHTHTTSRFVLGKL
jgi:hypothetical protein